MRQDPAVAAISTMQRLHLEPTAARLPSHALIGMKDYLAKATLCAPRRVFYRDKALLSGSGPGLESREERCCSAGMAPRRRFMLGGVFRKMFRQRRAEKPNATKIEIEVQSAHGGYVLINDQYDPDWQVQVNGHNARFFAPIISCGPFRFRWALRRLPALRRHYHVAGLNCREAMKHSQRRRDARRVADRRFRLWRRKLM